MKNKFWCLDELKLPKRFRINFSSFEFESSESEELTSSESSSEGSERLVTVYKSRIVWNFAFFSDARRIKRTFFETLQAKLDDIFCFQTPSTNAVTFWVK